MPLKQKKYKVEVPITLNSQTHSNIIGFHEPGSANKESEPTSETCESSFQIVGQGSDGAIEFSPNVIDFEEVKVNFSKKVFLLFISSISNKL